MAALVAALAAPASADDVQLWSTAVLQGPLGGSRAPMAVVEVQQRLGDDLSRPTVSLVRVGLGVRLAPDVVLLGGYHLQRTTPGGRTAINEHRIWQQISVPIHTNPDHLMINARFRLEQRIVEGAHDLGWRGRAQLRIQAPLAGRGSAGPLLWAEALLPFNDTDWGQRREVRQYRYFVGALVPLGRLLNLEAGYMTRLDRAPTITRVSHVANLTLSYRLSS